MTCTRERVSLSYSRMRNDTCDDLHSHAARLRCSKAIALLGSMLAMLAISSCGTLQRSATHSSHTSAVSLLPPDGVRVAVDSGTDLQRLAGDITARLSTQGGAKHSILAMSGGGANGAYGAGVIVGWTETGIRPEFDIVTGISTGALAAPFAFLGSGWDAELQVAYTDGATRDLLNWLNLSALISPSLFDSGTLEKLINRSITSTLLREVAIEHGKGRRLLVVTTNLDSEAAVIWDMGALAAHGDLSALLLFRRILLASASMPGLFSPVLIAGRSPDGHLIDEMHVDGTVSTPFLVIPESLLLWRGPGELPKSSAIYVLVNGQLAPEYSVTAGDLPSILGRSFESMSKASLRTTLSATAAFAGRNGMSLQVAEIPVGTHPSSVDLNAASMRALFDLGRARGAAQTAWSSIATTGVDVLSASANESVHRATE